MTHDGICREHRFRSTDPAITPPNPDSVDPGIPADFPWAPSTYPIPEWASILCPTPLGPSGSHPWSFYLIFFLIFAVFWLLFAAFELNFYFVQYIQTANVGFNTMPYSPGLFSSCFSLLSITPFYFVSRKKFCVFVFLFKYDFPILYYNFFIWAAPFVINFPGYRVQYYFSVI